MAVQGFHIFSNSNGLQLISMPLCTFSTRRNPECHEMAFQGFHIFSNSVRLQLISTSLCNLSSRYPNNVHNLPRISHFFKLQWSTTHLNVTLHFSTRRNPECHEMAFYGFHIFLNSVRLQPISTSLCNLSHFFKLRPSTSLYHFTSNLLNHYP